MIAVRRLCEPGDFVIQRNFPLQSDSFKPPRLYLYMVIEVSGSDYVVMSFNTKTPRILSKHFDSELFRRATKPELVEFFKFRSD